MVIWFGVVVCIDCVVFLVCGCCVVCVVVCDVLVGVFVV